MAKHKRSPLRNAITPKSLDYPSAKTTLAPATANRRKSGTQRAHEKHRYDLENTQTPPTSSPTLADRFHALPSELRTRIFSLLLVRPAKWDIPHSPSCALRTSNADITPTPNSTEVYFLCQNCYPTNSNDHRWTLNGRWETHTFVSPWRSKYAPPQLNPYVCTKCYDERWRACPRSRSLSCLCARRSDLDILLVCHRWHEEAGEAFYRGNTFCFEDTCALAGFVANTRPRWCDAVTRISLMAWSAGDDDDDERQVVETLEPKTAFLLRQALPSLAFVELDARCLTDVKSVRVLLRAGLVHRRVAIRFVVRGPQRCIPGTQGGTEYPWPQIEDRTLLRGGFPEEVARAMKGERRAWMKAGGKKSGRLAVEAACEEFRQVLVGVEGELVKGGGVGMGLL